MLHSFENYSLAIFKGKGNYHFPFPGLNPVHLKVTFSSSKRSRQEKIRVILKFICQSCLLEKGEVGLISLHMTESCDLRPKSKNKSLRSSNKNTHF